jgi:hypothetical protein
LVPESSYLKIAHQNDGCLNFVDENDEVLISGFGRRGKAKGDIPGVRFKVVKVSGVGLLALWKEKKVRNFQSLSDSTTQTPASHRRNPAHNSDFVLFRGFLFAVVYAMFVLHHALPNES